MTWLYPAEITPLSIRAPANAISTTANWAFSQYTRTSNIKTLILTTYLCADFMVVMVTPVAFASIGYQTYIIFAVINFAIVPSVYFFFPETAYRSLEEMDEIFQGASGAFDVVKIAHEMPHRYGKRGELLIDYEDTETGRRRSSVAGAAPGVGRDGVVDREGEKEREKGDREFREKTDTHGSGNGGAH
jgi:hypothetical protein